MKTSQDLLLLLKDIELTKTSAFSGIGLVLYKTLTNLPFTPLKDLDHEGFLPLIPRDQILNFLSDASTVENKYHDGFHLLNENLELTHISQFLAPPIRPINIKLEHGSRFTTALYTSTVAGIIACGVLSNNYSPTIFVDGRKL